MVVLLCIVLWCGLSIVLEKEMQHGMEVTASSFTDVCALDTSDSSVHIFACVQAALLWLSWAEEDYSYQRGWKMVNHMQPMCVEVVLLLCTCVQWYRWCYRP